MTKHRRIQNAILREFGTRSDMRIWPANVGVGFYGKRAVAFGVPGQADLTGLLPGGRRLEIEVKSPNDEQTKDQRRYQAMIERLGGLYILARSVADVAIALREEGYVESDQ